MFIESKRLSFFTKLRSLILLINYLKLIYQIDTNET